MNGVQAWFVEIQKDAERKLFSIELILHSKRNQEFEKKFDFLHSSHQIELGKLIEAFFKEAGKKVPEKPELIVLSLMALAHGLVLVKPKHGDAGLIGGKLPVLLLKGLLALGEAK